MKKLLTLSVFIILFSTVFAQSGKVEKVPFSNKHNVRVGWGLVLPYNGHSCYVGYPISEPYYRGAEYFTGSLFAEYTFQAQKWLEVGANISYANIHYTSYDRITDAKLGTFSHDYVGLMLTARFNYLNKGIWRLYGQISLGAMCDITTNGNYGSYTQWSPNFQLTFLGVSVGKKYYGFLEFPAIGSLGFVNAGFGIRF